MQFTFKFKLGLVKEKSNTIRPKVCDSLKKDCIFFKVYSPGIIHRSDSM